MAKPALEKRAISYLMDSSPNLPPDWKGPEPCPRCHLRGIFLELGGGRLYRHKAEQVRVNESWAWVTVSAQECHIMDSEGLMERMAELEATRQRRIDVTGHGDPAPHFITYAVDLEGKAERVGDFEVDLDKLIDEGAIDLALRRLPAFPEDPRDD